MSRLPRDARLYGSDPRDSQQIPEPYNLYQFYSASDGPWIPNGVIQPTATLNLSSHPPTYNTGARSFQGYRSTGLPSECGTAAEDSGYGGTRSTYSLVESAASIAENDRGTETGYLGRQSAEQLFNGLNISPAIPTYPPPIPYSQNHHVEYRCDQCDAAVKTRSELKPYKCNYESCPKATQGFSTLNDLARHKRTVHREIDHNVPVYICRHDPCTRKKEKPWPRADNFRSHLARSHNIHLKADHDLREYRQQYVGAKPHEPRHDRNSVPKVNSGRRSTQLQVAPPVHPHPDVAAIRTEATEAPELRGVGSSIEDIDPGPRPAQLQDSPDLRDDQSPAPPSDQVLNEIPNQSSSSCPPCGEKVEQSIAFEDLELSPVSGSGPLASNQIVEVVPMGQASLETSETALPRDGTTPEALDQDEIDCSGEEEEPQNHQESSLPRIESSDVSLQPKPSASENGIFEAQQTIVASDDAPGSSDDAPADTVTFNSRNPSELFTFLKQVPMDVALKNGASDVLSFLRNIPKDLLEKALNPEDQGATASTLAGDEGASHKGTATCTEPGCGKVFYRQCELRKHMKRHKKPYGCTYRICNKHFGSKNDWKRHESSQHFQLESWHCNVEGCGKVLPRRELFRSHLLNHHRLTDGQKVEDKLEKCRLGRHCDPRFWCGFCDKFIEVTGEVVNSWTKRCDHIDNHLFGKEGMPKKSMNEWRYLEDKLAEEESESAIVERLPELSKKRKATEALDARPSKKTLYRWRCVSLPHPTYHEA
ncbi:hypothetical protein BBK36DRAFT_1188342 [Trichoderma citrinoviride]|uniref:C2H2-type domain-containing protein n=1 Tax=Trichoderma citrinoviride TaxID=58853 RepID=A0A2T4BKF4_9HYPO|nr:hypothetical protein BBK36DRAFT_1188342 [Trichoderma citrinoviride]PTB69749.1 hypothetical protein BBK36DRAFT_1188342 [Trichoderma citrinoviride]